MVNFIVSPYANTYYVLPTYYLSRLYTIQETPDAMMQWMQSFLEGQFMLFKDI